MPWKKVRLPAFLITTALCCMGDGCGGMENLGKDPVQRWSYSPEQVCGWNAPYFWTAGTNGVHVLVHFRVRTSKKIEGYEWETPLDTIYSGPIVVPCPESDSADLVMVIQYPQ